MNNDKQQFTGNDLYFIISSVPPKPVEMKMFAFSQTKT